MWIFLSRVSMFLVTVLAGDQLLNIIYPSKEIKPGRIYSVDEVANLLKIKKNIVNRLIINGDLKAREVEGKHMILGEKLKEFLKN